MNIKNRMKYKYISLGVKFLSDNKYVNRGIYQKDVSNIFK